MYVSATIIHICSVIASTYVSWVFMHGTFLHVSVDSVYVWCVCACMRVCVCVHACVCVCTMCTIVHNPAKP